MSPTLSNEKQAAYHIGCSLRHIGQAFAALYRSGWARLVVLVAVVAVVLCLSGCASSSGWNPLRSWFGRKAAAEQKAEAKADTQEDKLVDAAHVEAIKTQVALSAAPASRPVDVAKRTNANEISLLTQRKPLAFGVEKEAKEIALGMLSEETAKREAAEKAQAAAEGENAKLSAQLEETRRQIKQLAAERAEEAARNLELANQLRWANIVKYAGIAASTLLSLAVIAYRLNIGRLQTGAAEVLAKLQAHHPEAATTARSALDAILHTGEQKGVAKAFFNLTSI